MKLWKLEDKGQNKGVSEHREVSPNSLDMIESDEIVQISLDENEGQMKDTGVHEDEKDEAPTSDAPFHLISFVARYVSGADLVKKN